MDLHDVEINDVLFVDKKCHNARIESIKRKSKQYLADIMDFHNEEINDVLFADE